MLPQLKRPLKRYKCPKCLMVQRQELVKQNKDTLEIDKELSIVCNAAPTAPCDSDPCYCGADWLLQ